MFNGVAVSVQYVSSTSVVLHAGMNDQSQHMQINETFSEMEHRQQSRRKS